VLSGGVMLRKSLFPKIRARMVAMLNGYIPVGPCLDADKAADLVVPSRWGNNAGIVGALTLAADALESRKTAKPKPVAFVAAAAAAAAAAVLLLRHR